VKILTEEIGNANVRRLTPDQIDAAFLRRTKTINIEKRRGRGRISGAALSRSSLIKVRSTLSQALTWAQRRRLDTGEQNHADQEAGTTRLRPRLGCTEIASPNPR
jgi:hypothetical protein